jgi:cytoskeletal protein CcmA (bactofilin family)
MPFGMLPRAMALFASKEEKPVVRSSEPQPSFSGTFISPNVTVEGTITGSEPVHIEGSINGTIDLGGQLRIGTKARITAKVHAKNITVEGRVDGDISADERVELVASATVDGNIRAPKIVVAEGAKFRGSVDMGSTKPKEHAEAVKK